MNKLFLLLSLLMTGCGNGHLINGSAIKKANELCASNGGIDFIYVKFSTTLSCKNGAVFPTDMWRK